MTAGSSLADQWVSVADAALLAHRSERTVYAWVRAGRVQARRGDGGATTVLALDVLEAERTVVRGRPTGTARPNVRHARMSDLQ